MIFISVKDWLFNVYKWKHLVIRQRRSWKRNVFFQFQAAMGVKGFFSRVRRLRRDASGPAVGRHIFGPRPKLLVTINTRSKPKKTSMNSLRASSPIWASEASLAITRSRETRFTRPNRRACSQARAWKASGTQCSFVHAQEASLNYMQIIIWLLIAQGSLKVIKVALKKVYFIWKY